MDNTTPPHPVPHCQKQRPHRERTDEVLEDRVQNQLQVALPLGPGSLESLDGEI